MHIIFEITVGTVLQEHIEVVIGARNVVETNDVRVVDLLEDGDLALDELDHFGGVGYGLESWGG